MDDIAASMGIRIRGFNPAQFVEESQGRFDDVAFHEEIPVIDKLGQPGPGRQRGWAGIS